MPRTRLFLLLFWLFVLSLLFAMGQNVYQNDSILSNDVFILMAICVILVLCDEVTRYLNSIKRIRGEVRKEVLQELRREGWSPPKDNQSDD